MAYRNGTYVAFHAEGNSDPTVSDMKYYRLLQAWHEHEHHEFRLVNSHEKAAAVRDTSKRETLARSLRERLNNSRNMVLIIGKTTKFDYDWVPFEIQHAVDVSEIPIIAAYPGYAYITAPAELADLWPAALATRIQSGAAHVIHVAFCKVAIKDAITQFDHEKYPLGGGLGVYSRETYQRWGLMDRAG